MQSRSTAAILVIGDEILKGQTKDTNSHFLCRELYSNGVKVCQVSVIGDELDIISEQIANFSSKYSFVLTSGGIGPTHDDVTYDGVAKAFNEKLVLNKEVHRIMSQLCLNMGWDVSTAVKMASVPESAEVHHTGGIIPIVSVRNVFIFPGIPSYLESTFAKLKPIFCKSASPYFNKCLYLFGSESDNIEALDAAVKEYGNTVRFGSYPIDSEYYQVKLMLEADTERTAVEAEAFLRSHLHQNSIVGPHAPISEAALLGLTNLCSKKCSNQQLSRTINDSLDVLKKCFNEYSIQNVCLSFNGGKDCTALLHLVHLFLCKKFPSKQPKLKVLYVHSKQPFPEIEEFINLSVTRYNLELLSYEQPIKDALQKLQKDQPQIQAIFMGSRKTDPHCSNIRSFQMTDTDWPQFMRVNVIAEWSYSQVWDFLQNLQVPYCSLYDRGYTSLGCRHNTQPNDRLLAYNKSGETYYLPAYLLKEPNQERNGRSSHKL